jgi:hypothetical protein
MLIEVSQLAEARLRSAGQRKLTEQIAAPGGIGPPGGV